MATVKLKTVLSKAECYTKNLSELFDKLDESLVADEVSGKLIITGDTAIEIIQHIWDEIKETQQECEGRTIEVRFKKNNLVTRSVLGILAVLGFRL